MSARDPDEGDEFEEVLELLIAKARIEKRHFLAYLLTMALIEARGEDLLTQELSH
jgi:hypothetical protein